jgi:hypothetical protein
MINRLILSILLPILIVLSAVPASAQGRRWQAQPYDVLELTEDQLAAIQEQRLAFQKEILSLRTDLMSGYMELDNLYLQDADQGKIEGKLAELDQMEKELDKRFDTHQQQIRSLLTDEQQVLFDRFGGLGMGPAFGMGYGAGYGRAWGRGAGRAGWGRGAARGYGRGTGYTRAPARSYGRGAARAGAAYRTRAPRNFRDPARLMRYRFTRCWRWR